MVKNLTHVLPVCQEILNQHSCQPVCLTLSITVRFHLSSPTSVTARSSPVLRDTTTEVALRSIPNTRTGFFDFVGWIPPGKITSRTLMTHLLVIQVIPSSGLRPPSPLGRRDISDTIIPAHLPHPASHVRINFKEKEKRRSLMMSE